jgi:hypothetical protein
MQTHRFYDQPMPGTIYRMRDDPSIVRGITYTFLPDGKSIRVPAMNRLLVRAAAESHNNGESNDIIQALQNIIMGKKGKKFNARGQAGAAAHRAPVAAVAGEGLRQGGIGAGAPGAQEV